MEKRKNTWTTGPKLILLGFMLAGGGCGKGSSARNQVLAADNGGKWCDQRNNPRTCDLAVRPGTPSYRCAWRGSDEGCTSGGAAT